MFKPSYIWASRFIIGLGNISLIKKKGKCQLNCFQMISVLNSCRENYHCIKGSTIFPFIISFHPYSLHYKHIFYLYLCFYVLIIVYWCYLLDIFPHLTAFVLFLKLYSEAKDNFPPCGQFCSSLILQLLLKAMEVLRAAHREEVEKARRSSAGGAHVDTSYRGHM